MSTRMTITLLVIALGTVGAWAAPVMLGLRGDTQETNIKFVNAAAATGAGMVYLPVNWAQIERVAGTRDFAILDAQIRAATAQNLTVVLMFSQTPAWAAPHLNQPSPEELRRAKPELTAYANFVKVVATRYRNKVRYYQAWERPGSATLLAAPRDVIALYREAAVAIHGVDPTLRVIAVEPGDVNLSWTSIYLEAATGAGRADVLLLTPASFSRTPRQLAWRMTVLRERVLPARAPELWLDIPVERNAGTSALSLAATGMLYGATSVVFSDDIERLDAQGLAALASVQGMERAGWATLTPGIDAAIYRDATTQRTLAVPTDRREVEFVQPMACVEAPDLMVPTVEPEAVAVLDATPVELMAAPAIDADAITPLPEGEPGGVTAEPPAVVSPATKGMDAILADAKITIYPCEADARARQVDTPTKVVLGPTPVVLTGVVVTATPGAPSAKPAPFTDTLVEVVLDRDCQRADGVHPMPNMRGGAYATYQYGEFTTLCTIRDKQPWICFDVPDGFLFFNKPATPIEVTITVMGASEPKRTGFNLYYDGLRGMNNSPWQWIDLGPDKTFTYTVRLQDALFANSEGYDFRISMGGSRESVRVVNVKVTKP